MNQITTFEKFRLFSNLLLGNLKKDWKAFVRQDKPILNALQLKSSYQFEISSAHMRKLKEVCHVTGNTIPLLYPAVTLFYPVAKLLTSSHYPFPAIGGIHTANKTILHRKLHENDQLRMSLEPRKEVVHAKKGSEVQLTSKLFETVNGADCVVWENSMTLLVQHKYHLTQKENINTWCEPLPSDLKELFQDTWQLEPSVAKNYAGVSQDYNPIHLHDLGAKLFGYSNIIIHGMYMLTRASAECQRILEEKHALKYPLEVSTKFQRPCTLPQKVQFKIYSIRNDNHRLYFVVLSEASKVLVDGYVTAGAVAYDNTQSTS